MSSDQVFDQDGLNRRAKTLLAEVRQHAQKRDQLVQERTALTDKLQSVSDQQVLLDQTGIGLRELVEQLVHATVADLESLVTQGLRAVIHDQRLALEAQIGTKYNRTVIKFLFGQASPSATADQGSIIRGDPLESFGGGPASFASLVLRLLTILRLRKAPFLLLDETLGALSDEYIEGTSRFLRELADTTGVDVLLITHKASFLDNATTAYQASSQADDNGLQLVLRRIAKAGQ